MEKQKRLTAEQIKTINEILTRGDRVELYPSPNGVQVIRIVRHNIKARPPEK